MAGSSYGVVQQPVGTRVSFWPHPAGPGNGTHYWGTVIQHFGNTLLIVWDDDDEFYEQWPAADVKYYVERGRMRLHRPPKPRRMRLPPDQLTCKVCGKLRSEKCNCPRPGALKPEQWGTSSVTKGLTLVSGNDMMVISNEGDALTTRKGATTDMARTKAPVTDEVADDEVEAEGSETLTAKQAATLIGTDAKTLRKFLRSKSGLVGQGQRWAVAADEIDDLKAEFSAWQGTKTKTTKATSTKKVSEPDPDELDDDEVDDLADEVDDELDDILDDDLEEL